MEEFREKAVTMLAAVLIAALLWVSISSSIQAFMCPKLTKTELLLRIPKSFVCDWENCE